MTRINAYIPPRQLLDTHLIAEIKEINQLVGSYKKSLQSKNGIKEIPNAFTLNTNHVKHFYDKGKWLHNRFNELKQEAITREFEINAEFNIAPWLPIHYNDWTPTENEIKKIRTTLFERISLRIVEQKLTPRYFKKDVSRSEAIFILTI